MRYALLCLAVILSSWTSAQTYFYIDAITVDPPSPAEQDEITIALEGAFSSTGVYISEAFAAVEGNTVTIQITAIDDVGGTVIVPHTELISVGSLAQGDYEIVIEGMFFDDLAASDDHFFTVTGGGDPCADLIIESVQWAPFSDTTIVVHAFNNSTELFDYPGFVLLDSNGDTLASETVNFFGIGVESFHQLTIHPTAEFPNGPFEGQLHLWTGFYSEQACTWELTLDLCPTVPCTALIPRIENTGSGIAIGSYDWTIIEEDVPVASGTFNLTFDTQSDSDTICLPPGEYFMVLVPQQEPTGGQVFFGLSTSGMFGGPIRPALPEAPLLFSLYRYCVAGFNAIRPLEQSTDLILEGNSELVTVRSTSGSALGHVRVMDVQGRIVAETRTQDASRSFQTSGWISGVYMIHLIRGGMKGEVLRFALE